MQIVHATHWYKFVYVNNINIEAYTEQQQWEEHEPLFYDARILSHEIYGEAKVFRDENRCCCYVPCPN